MLYANFTCQAGELPLRLQMDFTKDAPDERYFALVGRSGSGKSTSLRALCGLQPCEGDISFNSDTWLDSTTSVPPWVRPTGIVMQDPNLFDHLTVDGNLRFAERRAVQSRELTRDQVVELLGLEALTQRNVTTLSGGEQQRVAIARTLLSQPALLLLDEPFAALDNTSKDEVLPYLQRTLRELNMYCLIVSHNMDEIARLTGYAYLLENGHIAHHGPTQMLFADPKHDNLVSPEGNGVILKGAISEVDKHFQTETVTIDDHPWLIPDPTLLNQGEPLVGQPVTLVVRSSEVGVALTKPVGISIQNIVPATVVEVRSLGTTPYAEVDLSLGKQKLVARITRQALRHIDLIPGQAVYALVKSASLRR